MINRGWKTYDVSTMKVYHEFDLVQIKLDKVSVCASGRHPKAMGHFNCDDEHHPHAEDIVPLELDPDKEYAVGLGVNNKRDQVRVAQLADCYAANVSASMRGTGSGRGWYRALSMRSGGLFGNSVPVGETAALHSQPLEGNEQLACPLIYLTARVELSEAAAGG